MNALADNPAGARRLAAAHAAVVGGIGVTVAMTARADDWTPVSLAALLGAMTLLSEYLSRKFEVQGAINISGSDVYLVCAMALLGPAPAVTFVVVAELGRFVLDPHRPHARFKLLNNATALAAYALVGALIVRYAAEGANLQLDHPAFLALLVVVAVVANFVCIVIVGAGWHFAFGEPFREAIATFWRFVPSHAIAGLLAAVGVYTYAHAGFTPFAVLVVAFLASEVLLGRLSTVEVALRREHDLAQRYLDIVGTMVVVLDGDGRITLANREASRTLGYAEDELVGRSWRTVVGESPAAALAAARDDGELEAPLTARDGGERIVAWKTSVLRSEGTVSAVIVAGDDVTDRRHAEQEVAFLAFHDRLTRLPNRARLDEYLGNALDKARRDGERAALLYVDLDDFKRANDTLGHAEGDELLRQVAERLREATRETDLVVRHGGDEFLVFLPHVAGAAAPVEAAAKRADEVRQRIDAALREPFQLARAELRIGASIGAALFPEQAADENELVKAADAAMYEAKRAGRTPLRAIRVA